eukprot:TRINITY_DN11816_c0_g1::TRINITY_DN11816_c0_g1_i1::g.11536::m.11536 TRINITY_DN11816_c0_g1::TRINITY_DN11816_c0_g1_i1::g.11536  ORF type:complete len:520 (-),score=31.57,sp/Q8NEE8/TTC16_HUMAN/27.13/3e-44,TPR_11/PF13414.1/2.5e-13,TPR_11/PF13414.1/0.00033,TPR_11/PF13414.1/3.1e-06,TPR_11/PF13414.1/4.6e-08,TPR_11/PF13414.1/1.3e-11,TPR_11/PF13414.1/4.7e-07,TPR_11/PF13414.1/1.8e+03,TPR_2/PF07719.12/0.0012,TPR_2/PF07719.12/0.017,TPR_2/PF07719.12/0.0092,TPR_2/PF07719.12/10,TPR_2/PF07719.12/0.047,TPR_2/PF077
MNTIETANARNEEGQRYLNTNQLEDAIACFSRAIFLNPLDAVYYANRGDAFIRLCDLKSAIVNYRKAYQLASSDAHLSAYRGLLWPMLDTVGLLELEEEHYAAALTYFEEACALEPTNMVPYFHTALALLGMKEHKRSLERLDRLIEKDPKNFEAFIMRAKIHKLLNNIQSASADVHRAMQLDPNNQEAADVLQQMKVYADVLYESGTQELVGGSRKEALTKISRSIDIDPSDPRRIFRRGLVYKEEGMVNEAVRDFQKALEMTNHCYPEAEKHLSLTYNELGLKFHKDGDYQRAYTLFSSAIELNPANSAFFTNRGDTLQMMGNLPAAKLDFEKGRELNPHDSSIRLRLSLVYDSEAARLYREGKYTLAVDAYTQCVNMAPEVLQFRFNRSQAAFIAKRFDVAREDLEEVVKRQPQNHQAWTRLLQLDPKARSNEKLKAAIAANMSANAANANANNNNSSGQKPSGRGKAITTKGRASNDMFTPPEGTAMPYRFPQKATRPLASERTVYLPTGGVAYG